MTRRRPTNDTAHDAAADRVGRTDGTRLWTVPNVLAALRLIGAPVLGAVALANGERAFVALFLILALTDWVDGKLAVWLDQRSDFGARLDSWADAALYAALLLGGTWLRWEVLLGEIWWVAAAVASYTASTGAGFCKFGRWPSYHTRAAKVSWLLVTVGAICLLLGWGNWPFRLAMAAVTITNLEAILITCVLPEWQADVASLTQARQLAGRESGRSRSA
jgi:CDP-diacylglycerol--glycerol-3-phosphate 3-phosphatidyltransferase